MNNTSFVRFAGLLALIIVGILAGGLVQGIYLNAMGLSSSMFNPDGLKALDTVHLKVVLAFGHIFTFFIPPLLFSYLPDSRGPRKYFSLDKRFRWSAYLWSLFLLFAALPWVQYLQELNALIQLPDWARFMEQDAAMYIDKLLTMDSPLELAGTILIVAVLPAIGEELLFRGCLQKEIERFGSAHLAVWITAIVFSAFHLQFAGFLPRLGLGLLLGYLYIWTRTLWVPIVIHFIFNGLQVVLMYFMSSDLMPTEHADTTGTSTWALLGSTFCVFWASRQLIAQAESKKML